MSVVPAPRADRAVGVLATFPAEKLGDAALVEALVRGETAALGVIWDRYAELVRGVLRSALGPDQATEDLLQDAFLALFRGARSMTDGAALRGYLIGVTVRLVAYEIRRRRVRRWVRLTATGDVPDVISRPEDVESRAVLAALYRVLERLPSRQRLAFTLRHVQGLEVAELARALGVSESTAKREVVRARQRIAELAVGEPALEEYSRQRARGAK